jgi:hypothetical protein
MGNAIYQEQRNSENILEGYIRNSDNASIPIATSNRDYQYILKWIDAGGVPDLDDSVLVRVKQKKISEYKAEGVRRIGITVSAWDSFASIEYTVSIWNMLGTPNALQITAKNIFVYVKNTAIPAVSALGTVNDVQNIDVINDPNWP